MVFAAYRMCIAVTRAASMLMAGGVLPAGSEMFTNNAPAAVSHTPIGAVPSAASYPRKARNPTSSRTPSASPSPTVG